MYSTSIGKALAYNIQLLLHFTKNSTTVKLVLTNSIMRALLLLYLSLVVLIIQCSSYLQQSLRGSRDLSLFDFRRPAKSNRPKRFATNKSPSTAKTSPSWGASLSKKRKLLNFVLQSTKFVRTRSIAPLDKSTDTFYPQVESILAAADDRKASNPLVLRVEEYTEVTSYIIILEGSSTPQLRAIAGAIEETMKETHAALPQSLEGDSGSSGWVCMDYGRIIVHVMTPSTRAFYKLEKKWKNAEVLDMSHVLAPRSSPSSSSTPFALEDSDRDEEEVVDESDPFWA